MVLLCAASAFAAEDGGQSMGMNLAWRIINIIIFVAILYKFLGKKAAAFFIGRRDRIQKDLADLELRKEEAEKNLADIKTRIANLEQERRAIIDESRVQAENLRASILAEAEKQAAQIREQALRTAENEGKLAVEQLRAQLADEIVAAAEALLQTKLDDAQHDKLINNSLTKVVLN